MKKMLVASAAVVFALALTIPAFAGGSQCAHEKASAAGATQKPNAIRIDSTAMEADPDRHLPV